MDYVTECRMKGRSLYVTYGMDVNGQLIGAFMSVWMVSLPGANRAAAGDRDPLGTCLVELPR